MYVGIYRSTHTGHIEFDQTVLQPGNNSEGWRIIAVAETKLGVELKRVNPDQYNVWYMTVGEAEYTAQQVLEGDAGRIIVWHRGMGAN